LTKKKNLVFSSSPHTCAQFFLYTYAVSYQMDLFKNKCQILTVKYWFFLQTFSNSFQRHQSIVSHW